jgi:lysophospholipase L1-like esterase
MNRPSYVGYKIIALTILLGFALGPSAATQSDIPPWATPVALTPIQMRKPWIACYQTNQTRPDMELRMHNRFMGDLQTQRPAVLFVGDSIVGYWRRAANQESWKTSIAPLNACNLGVPSDMTENILWRLSNGELRHVQPKAIVLMTGTNNLWRDTPADITKGVSAIIALIQKSTNAKILLLGVLPRNDLKARPDFPSKIAELNSMLAKLADVKGVSYFYFGDKYLDQNGRLAKGFLADGLDPSPKGYQVWGEQIRPVLDEMMK